MTLMVVRFAIRLVPSVKECSYLALHLVLCELRIARRVFQQRRDCCV